MEIDRVFQRTHAGETFAAIAADIRKTVKPLCRAEILAG